MISNLFNCIILLSYLRKYQCQITVANSKPYVHTFLLYDGVVHDVDTTKNLHPVYESLHHDGGGFEVKSHINLTLKLMCRVCVFKANGEERSFAKTPRTICSPVHN